MNVFKWPGFSGKLAPGQNTSQCTVGRQALNVLFFTSWVFKVACFSQKIFNIHGCCSHPCVVKISNFKIQASISLIQTRAEVCQGWRGDDMNMYNKTEAHNATARSFSTSSNFVAIKP